MDGAMTDCVQLDLESKIYWLVVKTAGPVKMRPTDWTTIVAACKGSSEAGILQAIRTLIANGSIHLTSGGWLPGQEPGTVTKHD
jgi:hypothetical protein